MTYQVKLVKGLFRPSLSSFQLKETEEITAFKLKLVWVYMASILLFSISGYFGIGTESVSKELNGLSTERFETGKLLVFFGNVLAGLILPSIFLFVSAMIFWVITDIPYIKLVIVQMIGFTLFLMEKILLLPFFILMDLNQDANPFSLGVVSQYFIANDYFIHFFSEVSIFSVAIIVITYKYLKALSEKKSIIILLMVCISYLIYWFFAAFCSYLDVNVFV